MYLRNNEFFRQFQILCLTSRTTSRVIEDLEETWWEKLSTTMVRIKSTTYFRAGWLVSRPVRKVSIRPSSIEKNIVPVLSDVIKHTCRCGTTVWTHFKCYWKIIKGFFLQYFFVFFSLSLKIISLILACTHNDMNFNWGQLPQGKFLHLRGHVDLNYCSCLQ